MKKAIENIARKQNDAEIMNIEKQFETSIQSAKNLFFEGGIFIYPTDTIYGFGGNPFNEDVLKRISGIKRRSSSKRYILLIGDLNTLMNYVEIKSERHYDFLLSIWPNPVSVVLSLNKKTSGLLGLDTAAFRIPHHRFCNKLLEYLKMPLISTSVNRSDDPPLTEFSMIKDEFSSEVDAIFYTEKKSFIPASTLIDLTKEEPVLLREGKINFEKIMQKF
jgi:L-threonylcarbamoyladenylate synthase